MSSSRPGSDADRLIRAAGRYTRTGVRSCRQVCAFLERRGASADAAQRALAACRARGLVDDAAAARLWAQHWRGQGYAWPAITARLSEKGFHDRTIAQLGRRLARSSDEERCARQVVARLGRRPPALPAPKGRRPSSRREAARQAGRLARTLASRGFDSDVIERVLAETAGFPQSD